MTDCDQHCLSVTVFCVVVEITSMCGDAWSNVTLLSEIDCSFTTDGNSTTCIEPGYQPCKHEYLASNIPVIYYIKQKWMNREIFVVAKKVVRARETTLILYLNFVLNQLTCNRLYEFMYILCVTTDYGIYRGEMKDYTKYEEILTNR